MRALPANADFGYLKKQAKELIRGYRAGDPDALARFAAALPATSGRTPATIAALGLRLHDAQSCLAREYGFVSWADLKTHVEWQSTGATDLETRARRWLGLVYAGDVTGSIEIARPALAARMLDAEPALASFSPSHACAAGDEAVLRRTIAGDAGWIDRPGGPFALPPLVAVTHSSLLRLPVWRDRLVRCAEILLAAGASPRSAIGNRYRPASLAAPDAAHPLSALYGAAGAARDPGLTQLLLEAGADPNDGESLYHSLENAACTRLLLEHGARIGGTNAIYRALDLPDPAPIELLLAHGGDPNEPARNKPISDWNSPLLWAIRRRQSVHAIAALLGAGADPCAATPDGVSAYRMAKQFGLTAVAELLRERGGADALLPEEEFVAACTALDVARARAIAAGRPDLPAALAPAQLRLMPDLVAEGADAPARLMVELGWPIATPGGDWHASALNLAVFRGDAAMTRFLLEHGASWREAHAYDSNVAGTLGWASCTVPVEGGDWPGCARALLAHGMPRGEPDAEPDVVRVEGVRMRFSEEVADVLIAG